MREKELLLLLFRDLLGGFLFGFLNGHDVILLSWLSVHVSFILTLRNSLVKNILIY